MPLDPIQPDPQESTEAKLCAYLEGELSPAERIEIEQHLAANPQHRKLLGDLAKTRDWMRAIPRETSPVDLGEVFQGQVERSMLLDGPPDGDPGLSINRWPQYMVIAAITALTLGLGAVLIAVLSSPKSGSVATSSQGFSPESSHNTIAPGGMGSPVDIKPATGPSVDALSEHSLSEPGMAGSSWTKLAAKSPMPLSRQQLVTNDQALRSRLISAGVHIPDRGKTICLVVSADSPENASEHARQFFEHLSIAFESSAPPPLYANRGGVAMSQNGPYTLQGGNIADNNAQANSRNSVTAEKQAPAASPATAPSQTYYVARGVTPLQLQLLKTNLQTDDLKQTVESFTLSLPAADEPKQQGLPITGSIQKGQTLLVTIPQLSRPTAGTDKANTVRVADDGTIALPMIDPLPAAGLMPGELQKRIADKYREKDLIPDATVTILAVPTTQPTAGAMTLENKALDGPATRPEAETPVDVVVVIEQTKFPVPTTLPVQGERK